MVAPAPETPETVEVRSSASGFRVVWPGLGLLLLLGTLAYLAVPSVRDQLNLSLSRQDTPFVELSAVALDDASHVGTTCQAGDQPGTTQVVFAVRSHLRDRDTVRYQVAVTRPAAADQPDGTPGTPVGTRTFGKVNIDAGATRTITSDAPTPDSGAFDIEVLLPATDQHLVLHCDPDGLP